MYQLQLLDILFDVIQRFGPVFEVGWAGDDGLLR